MTVPNKRRIVRAIEAFNRVCSIMALGGVVVIVLAAAFVEIVR